MKQADRILAFLRAHPGCSVMELQYGMHPFIANPRARISELRQRGFRIDCFRGEGGVDRYHLVEQEQTTMGLAS